MDIGLNIRTFNEFITQISSALQNGRAAGVEGALSIVSFSSWRTKVKGRGSGEGQFVGLVLEVISLRFSHLRSFIAACLVLFFSILSFLTCLLTQLASVRLRMHVKS